MPCYYLQILFCRVYVLCCCGVTLRFHFTVSTYSLFFCDTRSFLMIWRALHYASLIFAAWWHICIKLSSHSPLSIWWHLWQDTTLCCCVHSIYHIHLYSGKTFITYHYTFCIFFLPAFGRLVTCDFAFPEHAHNMKGLSDIRAFLLEYGIVHMSTIAFCAWSCNRILPFYSLVLWLETRHSPPALDIRSRACALRLSCISLYCFVFFHSACLSCVPCVSWEKWYAPNMTRRRKHSFHGKRSISVRSGFLYPSLIAVSPSIVVEKLLFDMNTCHIYSQHHILLATSQFRIFTCSCTLSRTILCFTVAL